MLSAETSDSHTDPPLTEDVIVQGVAMFQSTVTGISSTISGMKQQLYETWFSNVTGGGGKTNFSSRTSSGRLKASSRQKTMETVPEDKSTWASVYNIRISF